MGIDDATPQEWDESARAAGINQGNITNCLQGRCKSVGGYKWLIK